MKVTAAAVAALVWFAVSEGSRMAAGVVFTGVVLVNVLFSIALLGRVHTVFAIVSEGSDDVTRYRRLIDAVSDLTPAAELLATLHGASNGCGSRSQLSHDQKRDRCRLDP